MLHEHFKLKLLLELFSQITSNFKYNFINKCFNEQVPEMDLII